jgi:prepilin-type N-terminal cleavage/methylation domain-containing protein
MNGRGSPIAQSRGEMRAGPISERGFSLAELMLTMAIAATLMAMAVPVLTDVTTSAKLNTAARTVERELQGARLKAVSTNSVLRVRTNCPTAGYIRTVEVLGNAIDSATNRCDATVYPYPSDNDLATRPNYDGPVRVLPNEATVTSAVLQFSPDGTVANVVANVPQVITTGVALTITRRGQYKTVTINAIGKVQLQ